MNERAPIGGAGHVVDSCSPREGKSPRFVVLELSEMEEGDADENFERLAPELIQSGIPAVLAMQYPCRRRPGAGVGQVL